jgi:aarF domain-containing kinase
VVDNLVKVVEFLTKGGSGGGSSGGGSGGLVLSAGGTDVAAELLPYIPAVAQEVLPELGRQLVSRISARLVREVFVGPAAVAPARR